MNVKELKEWFLYRLNNCYPVMHKDYSDIILWYYDEQYIRKTKLCKLSNKSVELPSNISLSGEFLFAHNIKDNVFYCDSDNIWTVFYNEYSKNYSEVQKLIKVFLEEELKMCKYKSVHSSYINEMMLNEESKMYVYTPKKSVSTQSWFKRCLIIC